MRTKNQRHEIPNGPIFPGSKIAKRLEFDDRAFTGYLWKFEREIWVPVIESLNPGQGNLKAFFKFLNDSQYKVCVPNPFENMTAILEHLGFSKAELPWQPSLNPPLQIGASKQVWECHRMAVIAKGIVLPETEKVEVWSR
jgi:hypothetical protein